MLEMITISKKERDVSRQAAQMFVDAEFIVTVQPGAKICKNA